LASVGWFISDVRILSKGDTVHVMKKPATKALQKLVRMSFRLHPAGRAGAKKGAEGDAGTK
jgi:hypothetical protein